MKKNFLSFIFLNKKKIFNVKIYCRIFSIFLSVIILSDVIISIFVPLTSSAYSNNIANNISLVNNPIIFDDNNSTDDADSDTEKAKEDSNNNSDNTTNESLTIYSKRAIIYERNSKIVLYGKNINEECQMASTTKIMSAIIVLENKNLNLDDIVTISKKSASTGGSRLGLSANDKITVRDLLYGLLLCSGNDCAIALAEYTSGSVDSFLIKMNEKAISLGLNHTHFESPHGLDSSAHYTTAYELALITDYALNINDFLTIVGTKKYTVTINNSQKQISNTNELLGKSNVYGGKTGYTSKAGRCLVTASKKDDNTSEYSLDIIVVVLGADTKSIRTQDSKNLIEYAFDTFSLINLLDYIETSYSKINQQYLRNINIDKTNITSLNTKIDTIKYTLYPIKKENTNIVTTTATFISKIAPIKTNSIVARIHLYIDNKFIFSTNIITTKFVKRFNPLDYIYLFFKDFKKILNNI